MLVRFGRRREIEVQLQNSFARWHVMKIHNGRRIGVALNAAGVVVSGWDWCRVIEPVRLANDGIKVEERGEGSKLVLEGEASSGGHGGSGEEIEIERRRTEWGGGNGGGGGGKRSVAGAGRLDGAAVARAGVRRIMEVGLCLGAAEFPRRRVVGPRCLFGGVERPQPDAALLPWIPYLGCVPPPRPLPHPSVMHLLPSSSSASHSVAAPFLSRRHRIKSNEKQRRETQIRFHFLL